MEWCTVVIIMLKFLFTMEHLNLLSKIYKENTWLIHMGIPIPSFSNIALYIR